MPYSTKVSDFTLRRFVTESNAIEGIRREPTEEELEVSGAFLDLDEVAVDHLQDFVAICQPGAKLRTKKGMNVRVGSHRPPPGGHLIRPALKSLLVSAQMRLTPYEAHQAYETLHPFMDCNGRSGRILWAWQMVRLPGWKLDLGFLHAFYYQALENGR